MRVLRFHCFHRFHTRFHSPKRLYINKLHGKVKLVKPYTIKEAVRFYVITIGTISIKELIAFCFHYFHTWGLFNYPPIRYEGETSVKVVKPMKPTPLKSRDYVHGT